MKSATKQLMIGLSSLINHTVAARAPGICPFILVCEFPRSGANWIRDMIGDALQIPVPRYGLFPVSFEALVHSHFNYKVTSTPVVYVVRDGRDILVSHYYKALNTARYGSASQRKRVLTFHRGIITGFRDAPLGDNLRTFYEEWKSRPYGSRVSWTEHIDTWLKEKTPNIHVVRYEDMLAQPKETLSRITSDVAGEAVDEDIIDFAVERNRFERKTGRASGQAKDDENRRSGNAGGWRNTLPADLQEKFLEELIGTLRLAGYET